MTGTLRGVLGVLAVVGAHATSAAQTAPQIDEYLRSMRLSPSEIADASNGKPIVKD